MHDAFRGVAIVGAYNTKQAKRLEGISEPELLLDAMRGTLAAAGVEPSQVDGINVNTWVTRMHAREAIQWFGARPMWTGTAVPGIEAVLEAASAIATGQAETVLVAAAQCGEYTQRDSTVSWTRPSNEFVECWGLYTAAEFALMAQRHMHLYGTKREALSEVAAAIRMNGARNPEAVMFGREVTPEDVESPRAWWPSPSTCSTAASTPKAAPGMVLTTAERARDLDATPISRARRRRWTARAWRTPPRSALGPLRLGRAPRRKYLAFEPERPHAGRRGRRRALRPLLVRDHPAARGLRLLQAKAKAGIS